MSSRIHITRLKTVYRCLEELATDVVFIGGATVWLYADRPFVDLRPTDDVDILVELLNYQGYAQLEEKLRTKGFENDINSGIICRYKIDGIIVDVMPTKGEILGFANSWYPEAYSSAELTQLDHEISICIFQPVYFLATKMEAFANRGNGDGRLSSDFEDIVFLLNKRTSIWDELTIAPPNVRNYLQEAFSLLEAQGYLEEWISSHIEFDEQKRVTIVLGGIRRFIANEDI